MKREDRPSGPCSICNNPRIQLSNGVWVCRLYYGSPMHFCDPMILREWSDELDDYVTDGMKGARELLEEYAGCSLEQYLRETGRNG